MNYLKLYLRFMKAHLMTLLEYKFDFLIGFSTQALWGIISALFIWIIFTHVATINGWSLYDMLFLSGFSVLTLGIFRCFFHLWDMDRLITEGEFDKFLTKPLNPLFQLITSNLDSEHFGDIFSGSLMLYISSVNIGIDWNIINISIFLLFLASSVTILFSIMLVPTSLAFWTTRSQALANVVMHFREFALYPLEIYSFPIIFLVSFILPFAFTAYYPAQLFLGKGIAMQLAFLTPLAAAVMFGVAYNIWKFGLKAYSSAGS